MRRRALAALAVTSALLAGCHANSQPEVQKYDGPLVSGPLGAYAVTKDGLPEDRKAKIRTADADLDLRYLSDETLSTYLKGLVKTLESVEEVQEANPEGGQKLLEQHRTLLQNAAKEGSDFLRPNEDRNPDSQAKLTEDDLKNPERVRWFLQQRLDDTCVPLAVKVAQSVAQASLGGVGAAAAAVPLSSRELTNFENCSAVKPFLAQLTASLDATTADRTREAARRDHVKSVVEATKAEDDSLQARDMKPAENDWRLTVDAPDDFPKSAFAKAYGQELLAMAAGDEALVRIVRESTTDEETRRDMARLSVVKATNRMQDSDRQVMRRTIKKLRPVAEALHRLAAEDRTYDEAIRQVASGEVRNLAEASDALKMSSAVQLRVTVSPDGKLAYPAYDRLFGRSA